MTDPSSDEDDHPQHLLTAEEEDWIRGGGRLVLAVIGRYATLSTRMTEEGTLRKVFPLWKTVRRLAPPRRRTLTGTPAEEAPAVFAAEGGPLIAHRILGKGDLFLLACPEVFQNRLIGEADHLPLLMVLAGTGRPVYFDEFVHGLETRAGILEILGAWGLGPLLILALLTAAAWGWRRRVRLGPPEDDYRESRIEAIDFVDSLALLYDRTLRRRQALALYAKAFEESAAAQTGLRGAALEAKVRDFLKSDPSKRSGGKDLSPAEFRAGLTAINAAFRRLDDAQRPGSRRKASGTVRPA